MSPQQPVPEPSPSDLTLTAPAGMPVTGQLSEVDLLNAALRPVDGSPPRYVASSKLGEGGMGGVFRAEQRPTKEGELHRRDVALKVIPLGMNSRQVVARFEAERQALALMNHPGIATVLDAGLLSDGRPFFAMEYVPGRPISEFADQNRLTFEQRLRLFQQVCEAVQHAHSKGVIHRDLKPSNVLAFLDNGQPRAKVIDFGIAKAMGGKLADATLHTQIQQAIGTWAYMSPEQAAGDPDIDVRTDVYALGMILYELLAGVHPFDLAKLAEDELRRVIRDVDPPKPDTRLSSLGEERASRVSSGRGMPVGELRHRLAGELGWIPLKALKKRRSERYETVPALQQDIERYLGAQPLLAGPDSAVYRLRKFVRRHRGAVAAVSIVLLVLIAGIIGSTTGWRRAALALDDVRAQKQRVEEEKQKVTQQRDNAAAVLRYVSDDLLGRATPQAIPDRAVREQIVKAMIDPAAERVGKQFAAKPQIEASLRHMIALSLNKLGQAERALPQIQRALELRRAAQPPDELDLVYALNGLGGVLQSLGRAKEAAAAHEEALQLARKALGPEHPETLITLSNYAMALEKSGRSAEAEPLFKQAWETQRRILGDDHPVTISALNNYASAVESLGRLEESEPLHKQALELRRKALGEDDLDTIVALNNYAKVLSSLGGADRAAPLFQEVAEKRIRVLGEDHPDTLSARNNHAYALELLGRAGEAEPIFNDVLKRRRRVLGEDHPHTIMSLNNYAYVLQALGRNREAEDHYQQAIERLRRVHGDDHPQTLISINNYSRLLIAQRRAAEVEQSLADAVARAQKNPSLGPGHPVTQEVAGAYARCLDALNRPDEAAAVRRKNDLKTPR